MKKIYLLLVGLLFVGFLNAQTFVSEDFSAGTMPPSGWYQLPLTSGWNNVPSSVAGGIMPECKFIGYNSTGTARLMSPASNMNSTDTAAIIFKHSYDRGGSGVTIGVATRSGGEWVTVWQVTPTDDIDAEEVSITLTGDQITGSNFQFSFFVEGTLSAVNGWYIDDIEFFAPLKFDAKLSTILIPEVISNPAPVAATVLNLGNDIVNEVVVTWRSYAGIERDSTFSDLNLEFAESALLEFNGSWASPLGSHDLKMWINTVNGVSDMNQDNDTLVKSIEYQSVVYPVVPLYEEFTSSTCAPCASFNSSFVPWCNTHAEEITLIKYQMNWPGAGDPYYTAEGGTRRSLYGVNAVPDLVGMGENIAASVGAANQVLNKAALMSTTYNIASSFTMDGSMINITTNILSFANASSLKVHNVVVEKLTTQNAATNGETEFEHVMMKMMPNANGATKSFVSGVPVQLTYQYDMASTNVEQLNDLLVVCFIQDGSNKVVYQSAYGEQDVVYSDEARLSSMTLDGVPIEGFDPDIYEYTIALPEGTIEEPVLGSTPMDDGATVITNMAFAIPGTATIDVYAEDLFSKKTYTVNYYIHYVGENEMIDESLISVYPNPANNELTLKGFKNADVSVLSSSGAVVIKTNNFDGGSLDISKLSSGVYFVRIRLENNQTVHKKIIVL